ncbi:MAG: MerR family transcriptional regulator, partial [gamma proteobacterium symbiont of Ctena orbiculata]
MNGNHNISDVSRISGIPKDLLRMWERRYKYPMPARDDNGDRVYSDEELNKLVLIRQLVDQGRRPGKLMALDINQLTELLKTPKVDFDFERLIDLLKAGDAIDLH